MILDDPELIAFGATLTILIVVTAIAGEVEARRWRKRRGN